MSQNLITEECELSKKYELELEIIKRPDLDLVSLTPENVAKVEAMIRFDSRYRQDDSDKYFPHWLKELRKYLRHPNGETSVYDFEKIIENAINKVDTENSTHLNADLVGRDEIKKRILECENRLLEFLEKRDCGFKFINFLADKTHPLSGKRARYNISFASKFCHYACFYIFEGEDAQDNFSIYDSVVAKVLPYYLNQYQIELEKKFNPDSKDYETYSTAIDEVIKASGNKISRNGFDHLLWYYFKDKELPKAKRRRNDGQRVG